MEVFRDLYYQKFYIKDLQTPEAQYHFIQHARMNRQGGGPPSGGLGGSQGFGGWFGGGSGSAGGPDGFSGPAGVNTRCDDQWVTEFRWDR
ncbi:hypothetical protein E2562_038133 [Oryza meyeriana var. granulata]|uniref:Uncharacterized protein n=1 Tax=Oryza meyeriana var. granulata TaxID=110450 RepID=A0A6G1DS92_9ORYZ|nr:hypothetical protein E2562_038133 [Oryza meyeriana var. granulata]